MSPCLVLSCFVGRDIEVRLVRFLVLSSLVEVEEDGLGRGWKKGERE